MCAHKGSETEDEVKYIKTVHIVTGANSIVGHNKINLNYLLILPPNDMGKVNDDIRLSIKCECKLKLVLHVKLNIVKLCEQHLIHYVRNAKAD